MGPARHVAIRIAVGLSAAALAAGGSAAAQAARPASGGGPAPAPAAAGLPSDWPADLPLPSGTLQASSGAAGHWTVQLLVSGSAAAVKQSAVGFYTARGYRQVADGVLDRGPRRITVVVENRDHSAARTVLVLGVDDAGATAPASLAVSGLSVPARVGLARARRDGLVVRFRASGGASSATVRADRVTRAGRRPVGSRTARVRPGANVVALDAAAVRRRLAPGSYRLTVVVRGTGGGASRPATAALAITRR